MELKEKSVQNTMTNPLWKVHEIVSFVSTEECDFFRRTADTHGGWTNNRHENYPTTDIPIEQLKDATQAWSTVSSRIVDACKEAYGLEDQAVIEMFDVFVVKYDASGQAGLRIHRDVSELSFVILLSDPSDFVGGGTLYESHDEIRTVDQGSLLMHCGKMRHGGVAITKGTRYVLIGFMKVTSKKIGQVQVGEPSVSNDASDKRHLDFLWRGRPVPRHPRHVAVRIINLRFRPEKLQRIQKVISMLCKPEGFEIHVKNIVANEGDGATAYPLWRDDDAARKIGGCREPFWSRDVKTGEIGVFVSHLMTLQDTRDETTDYMLVLEDDADFHSDLLFRIDECLDELKGQEWDVIDFGGLPVDDGTSLRISDSLCRRGFTYQCHCMLYSKSGMDKLGQVDRKVNAIGYDEFIPAARGIHPRKALNDLWPIGLDMYHTRERLSWQTGCIHDSERDVFEFTDRSDIPTKAKTRAMDDYDMINWYSFNNVQRSVDHIRDLCVKANESMWGVQISHINGSFSVRSQDWSMAVDTTKKLTMVLFESGSSELQINNGEVRTVTPQAGTLVIFPSYLLFRCSRVSIFYAFGDTFR